MNKLVVLKLDGDLKEKGFRVTLEIGEEGDRPFIEMSGDFLPPNPTLDDLQRDHWEKKYRNLEVPYRIKPQEIEQTFVNRRIEECKESEDRLRTSLRDWLKAEQFRPIDERLRLELKPDETIRILISTDSSDIQKLPWQEWELFNFKHYPNAEIALTSRGYQKPKTSSQAPGKTKVKILAILGHDDDIDSKSEQQLLENLPNAETTFLVKPQLHEINDQLWEQPWDILFFAGHSETKGDTGLFYINATDSITVTELWYGFKKLVDRGLKLAIFNSCDGLGLARQLNDIQIPQMIVMREVVPDCVAQEFFKHFLAEFTSGKPLYMAARSARERLQGLERRYPCASWLPVIWQNPTVIPPSWEDLLEKPPSSSDSWEEETRSSKLSWRSLQIVLGGSLIITGLLMWGRWQGKLQNWELQAYDRLMQQRPVEQPDKRILVVRVTPSDIEDLNQLPSETGQGARSLSDRTLEALLEKLEKYKPIEIGLNIFREGEVEPVYKNLKTWFQQGRLIAQCGTKSPTLTFQRAYSAPVEVPQKRIGFADLAYDKDKVIRRHLLLIGVDNPKFCKAKKVEAFSLKLAESYLNKKGIKRSDSPEDNFLKIGKVKFNPLKLHTGGYHSESDPHTGKYNSSKFEIEKGIQVMLNYRSYRDYKRDIVPVVSLSDVLNDELTTEQVKDRIVIIGVDANDNRYSTPYTKDMDPLEQLPVVFIQAQMVSHILSAVEGERPLIWTWAWWGDALWVWGWSLVGGGLAWSWRSHYHRRSLLTLLAKGGIAFAILYGFCFGFLMQGGWIPLVPSALALFITGSSACAYKIFQNRTIR